MTDREIEIAIVEDNPNDAELILRALKKHNLASRVVVLRDGAEALEFLLLHGDCADRGGDGALKVILLDLKLPKVDGIEVLRQIKRNERTRRIPVVALTSSTEQRDLKDAYELGVNSYVVKPIRFDEFAQVVSEVGLYWLLRNKCPLQ